MTGINIIMYKAQIYEKQNQGDEHSEKEFNTKEELVEYLTEQAEHALHVGDDYLLVDGGWRMDHNSCCWRYF